MKEYIVKVDEFGGAFKAEYPIIEKTEFIRCKDCTRHSTIHCPIYKQGYWTKPEEYCFMAERKEE